MPDSFKGSRPLEAMKRAPFRQPPALESGRGRTASTPSDIPSVGWKDILWRVYQNVPEHRIVSIAAGVAFYVLLAIFPGIAALVALYGLFSDPSMISRHLDSLAGLLPGGATDVIGEQLGRLTAQPNSTLGFAFLIGLLVSLWSANAGMKALVDALNIVYGEKEKRGLIKLNALSLAFTLGALLFMLLALAAIAVLPLVMSNLGLATATEWLVAFGKWPVLFLAVVLVIALIYRYGPSREQAQWRWITWGSALAAIAWLVMSLLFSWYAAKFGSFNKTYGSLGAVIGFMTWIWLSSIVILIGAELDAEMEHQTACDTTTGPAKPVFNGQAGYGIVEPYGSVRSALLAQECPACPVCAGCQYFAGERSGGCSGQPRDNSGRGEGAGPDREQRQPRRLCRVRRRREHLQLLYDSGAALKRIRLRERSGA
jgi:membrane protein